MAKSLSKTNLAFALDKRAERIVEAIFKSLVQSKSNDELLDRLTIIVGMPINKLMEEWATGTQATIREIMGKPIVRTPQGQTDMILKLQDVEIELTECMMAMALDLRNRKEQSAESYLRFLRDPKIRPTADIVKSVYRLDVN